MNMDFTKSVKVFTIVVIVLIITVENSNATCKYDILIHLMSYNNFLDIIIYEYIKFKKWKV